MNFSFKTYSWSIGTTSFRVKEINCKIEKQLKLLNELFKLNPNKSWRELQETYYEMMKESGLTEGDAKRKDKDARQKTSGLKDIGLIDQQRKITEVGKELLNIMESDRSYESNDFMIEKDSFLYLKQLLKLYIKDSEFCIKPFVALVYFIEKLGYITYQEFTYLLPICKNAEEVKLMVNEILKFKDRKNEDYIDSILIKRMHQLDNYKEAFLYFLKVNTVDEDVICNIGMNRKSRIYDKKYFDVYKALRTAVVSKLDNELKKDQINNLLKKIKKLSSSKAARYWIKYLFGEESSNYLQIMYFDKNILNIFIEKNKEFSERRFRTIFFNMLHLFKWKANLEEYSDLNQRYFELSDIIVFDGGKIELTFYAKYFFKLCIDELLDEEIKEIDLGKSLSLEQISDNLNIKKKDVLDLINKNTDKK